jgi:hypothetical protein
MICYVDIFILRQKYRNVGTKEKKIIELADSHQVRIL